jgi:hypothetical protein
MPRFPVDITYRLVLTSTVVVTAKDEEEAQVKAAALIKDMESPVERSIMDADREWDCTEETIAFGED